MFLLSHIYALVVITSGASFCEMPSDVTPSSTRPFLIPIVHHVPTYLSVCLCYLPLLPVSPSSVWSRCQYVSLVSRLLSCYIHSIVVSVSFFLSTVSYLSRLSDLSLHCVHIHSSSEFVWLHSHRLDFYYQVPPFLVPTLLYHSPWYMFFTIFFVCPA